MVRHARADPVLTAVSGEALELHLPKKEAKRVPRGIEHDADLLPWLMRGKSCTHFHRQRDSCRQVLDGDVDVGHDLLFTRHTAPEN